LISPVNQMDAAITAFRTPLLFSPLRGSVSGVSRARSDAFFVYISPYNESRSRMPRTADLLSPALERSFLPFLGFEGNLLISF